MPTTRASARTAEGSSPTPSTDTGSKRKAEASPAASPSSKAKKEKKAAPKKQKTLEDSMPELQSDSKDVPDVSMKDAESEKEEDPNPVHNGEPKNEHDDSGEPQQDTKEEEKAEKNGADKIDSSLSDQKEGETGKQLEGTDDDAVEKSAEREKSTPSSIMEKGIIYFFFRGRVGIDEPSDVGDVARSYIVLRPIPHGAKLGDGPMGDDGNNRVLALPKKVLPKSPRDRFMVFVEKAKVGLQAIKDEFLSASDYETKTAGTRHSPAATPIAEGVYCVTSTGRESHLAYILTIPAELDEVQKDIGLQAKGSFVTSVKNPQHDSPAQAQLPEGPKFPQEILDEFRSLRWMPLQPKHLEYENCQFLLIGHKDNAFEKATEAQKEDDGKEDPKEEMEKLEHEDELRVQHLNGDDTVFEDLNISARDYPKVQTTW